MYHSAKYPSVVRKKITVKSFVNGMRKSVDEKLSDLSTAKLSYNFDYSSGVLKRGGGVKVFNSFNVTNLASNSVLALYFYKRYDHFLEKMVEKIIYYCSDKHLYSADVTGGTFTKISDVTFDEKPLAINYDYMDSDVMLFASKSGELYYLNDTVLNRIEGAPKITSLCVHKERIFVTTDGEGTSLWFSDDFDPTNWVVSLNEAGFIDFQGEYGKLVKAVSFLDYVYVFRDYGISRVTAYGSQEDFSADTLFGRQGKIYGESVTDCGDFIIMLTTSGIYQFNGLDTVKILSEYDDMITGVDNSLAKGIYVGNVFYLKMKMNVNGKIEDVLLVYDTVKKSSYIARYLNLIDFSFFGGSVNEAVCLIGTKKYPCMLSNSGTSILDPLVKEWISPFYDLGVNSKLKRLYKLSLYTLDKITLTIECDNKKLVYNFTGGGVQEVYPALQGELFRISIKSTTNSPEIYNLTVFVEYVKGDA